MSICIMTHHIALRVKIDARLKKLVELYCKRNGYDLGEWVSNALKRYLKKISAESRHSSAKMIREV